MNNRTLLVVAVVVIVVAGVAYAMGHRQSPDNPPQGVIGNAMSAVGDKIDQAADQSKADADKNSAQQHIDAAKAGMGITPSNGQ